MEKWQTLSQILANLVQALALVGAAFIFWKWTRQRLDRSTEVLFNLADRFQERSIQLGCSLIEESQRYGAIRLHLYRRVKRAVEGVPDPEVDESEFEPEHSLAAVDAFLAFYVLLTGVRGARQTRDAALRACFRYWLGHYHHPDRWEFRIYVYHFFPTLRKWLDKDRNQNWLARKVRGTFFRPEDFGWTARPRPHRSQIQKALREKVLVITGSGVSRESGIPTYRGPEGLWEGEDPREMATEKKFREDPAKVWRWYRHRRETIRQANPNPGHFALKNLADLAKEFLLVTQNVDDLHERAGTDPSHLVHIHGDIFKTRCSKCGTEQNDAPGVAVPQCQDCKSDLRPGVVWFGEDLDEAQKERIEKYINGGPCDLVLVVGTTAGFTYIIDWIRRGAGETGWIVEVNPRATLASGLADLLIRGPAGHGLPELLQRSAFETFQKVDRMVPTAKGAGQLQAL